MKNKKKTKNSLRSSSKLCQCISYKIIILTDENVYL